MISPFAFSRLFRPFKPAAAICLLLLPLLALADDGLVNWPVIPAPPGVNSAAFPTARNDWMVQFTAHLTRTKAGNIDLIFDGDSITALWMGPGREVWNKNYAKLNAYDFGIGGDRTENVLWRLDHGQVAGLHPKMIVLLIGTNNVWPNTPEQIAEGVTAIVHEYQQLCPEAVILLQGIFPRGEKPTDPLRDKIKTINTLIAKLDDGKKVIYVDFGEKFLAPDGTITRDMMGDFLHPVSRGYEIWADAIRPEIEKVFGAPSLPPAAPAAPAQ